MKLTIKLFAFLIATLFRVSMGFAQSSKDDTDLTTWPKGKSPQEIGKIIADRFISNPYPNNTKATPPKMVAYPETCAWYGALTFAKVTKNKELLAQLIQRFEPLFGKDSTKIPKPLNVDYTVFGSVPLELYIQTKEKKYLEIGQKIADKQWEKPDTSKVKAFGMGFYDKGLSWQTRLWIDDMFMITAIQTQAYRATGDVKYINRAAKEMVLYLDSLQRPNGLFYHAPDVPFFWGRGNGWMAAGMSEILRSLPKNNPDRPKIMAGYKKMMEGLLKNQAPDGMWRQLLDDQQSWPETSCTGMFAFAMITGVKNGWLDKKIYAPAARKAWLTLITYINENGDIREVCGGTNKKNDHQYYIDRPRVVGDFHGQAPVLWCASALLR